MAVRNSPLSGRSDGNNGDISSIFETLWRHPINAMKACTLFLVFINISYFAIRYVELTKTLRSLEEEKTSWSNNLQQNIRKVKEQRPANDAASPQLQYSQTKYYPYLFNEPDKCKDDNLMDLPVFLLIVIKSTISQSDRRRAIRLTWGNESNIEGIIIRRIFLLARASDEKQQSLLQLEAEEYHDIIQGDFHDSFRNLTIKDIMFMRWMVTYCPQVKFIFKGDDDVFVNIHNIVDYLTSLSREKAKNLFAGSVLYPSPRITNPKSKYYVSTNLWNEKYYPPYVSGGGFVMSSLVSKKIFEVTKVTPIIPIDDAFLGVCLKKLGMRPQNHKGFKSWGVNRPKDICIYREIMTLHKLNSSDMIDMWNKLQQTAQNFSDCALSFTVLKSNNTEA